MAEKGAVLPVTMMISGINILTSKLPNASEP
jgi:hypothetical protein